MLGYYLAVLGIIAFIVAFEALALVIRAVQINRLGEQAFRRREELTNRRLRPLVWLAWISVPVAVLVILNHYI